MKKKTTDITFFSCIDGDEYLYSLVLFGLHLEIFIGITKSTSFEHLKDLPQMHHFKNEYEDRGIYLM